MPEELLSWDDITSSEDWKSLDSPQRRSVLQQYQNDLSKTSSWKSLQGTEKSEVLKMMRIDGGFLKPEDLQEPSIARKVGEKLIETGFATAETASAIVRGAIAWPIGLLTEAGVLAIKSPKEAREARETVEREITGPPPVTEMGKGAMELIGKGMAIPFYPAEKAREFVTERFGEEAGAVTGITGETLTGVGIGAITGGVKRALGPRKPAWERPVTEREVAIEPSPVPPTLPPVEERLRIPGEERLRLPAPEEHLALPEPQGFLMKEPPIKTRIRPDYGIPPEVKTRLKLYDPAKHTSVIEGPVIEIPPELKTLALPPGVGFTMVEPPPKTILRKAPHIGKLRLYKPEEVPLGVGPPPEPKVPKTIKISNPTPTQTFKEYAEERGYKWDEITRKHPDYPSLYSDYWEQVKKEPTPFDPERVADQLIAEKKALPSEREKMIKQMTEERAGTISLYHSGVELKPGMEMKADPNGLVWFTPQKGWFGIGEKGVPTTTIEIPKNKLLIISDQSGPSLNKVAQDVNAIGKGTKKGVFEEAEKRGYLAVQRGNDVSMRPETAKKYLQMTEERKTILGSEAGFIEIPVEEIKRAVKRIEEFWKPLYTLPHYKEILDIRSDAMGRMALVDKNVEYAIERTKKLSDLQKRDIFQAINGDISMDMLDPLSKEVAMEFKRVNDQVGKMQVDRKMITQEQYDAHKGHYVHYRYLRHILGDDAPIGMISGKLDLRETLSRNPKLTKEQRSALGLIDDISKAEPIGLAMSLGDVVKYDYFEQLASDPRNVWMPSIAEIHDIPKEYATSAMAQGQATRLSKVAGQTHEIIANTTGTFSIRNKTTGQLVGMKMPIGDLVKEVEAYKKMRKASPNSPEILNRLNAYEVALNDAKAMTKNAPRDFVQMPVSKKWGNLSGTYIRKEIARDLFTFYGKEETNIPELSKTINRLSDIDSTLTGIFKMGKVPFNIPTMIRNIASNPFQWAMSGTPPWEIPIYMVKGINHAIKKDVVYAHAFKKGTFKTNWSVEELREVMEPFRALKGDSWGNFLGALQKVAKYYGRIDDIYKMGKFTEVFEKTGDVNLASREANKWIMDYSLADPSIKWARRHFIPFATYQYKIAPLIAESLIKRPWVIGGTIALPYAMIEVFKEVHKGKVTDDDIKELQKGIPREVLERNNYLIVPWKIRGKWYWADYSYYLPWGNYLQAGQALRKGEIGEAAGGFGLFGTPFLKTVQGLAPALGAYPKVPRDPYTNKEIYSTLDDNHIKAAKLLEWFYNQMAPSMLTRMGALGYFADIGTKDKYGRTTIPEQAFGRLVGVNLNEINKQVREISKKYQIDEFKKEFSRIMSDPKISSAKKKTARENFIKEINKIREQK